MSDFIRLLDEIRAIGQNGLNYATDAHDVARYDRLLELASARYAELAGLPATEVRARFARDLGHVTPKVGAEAAIPDGSGRLLVIRRSDDGCWALPGGWCEVGESPQETVRREVAEETGLEVRVGSLVGVFARLPDAYGDAHTLYSIVYRCEAVGGEPAPTPEAVELGYHRPADVDPWHKDHRVMAEAALGG